MHVEDQVRPFVQEPGHAVGLDVGHGPRLPEEEMALRLEALGRNFEVHAAKSRLAVLSIEAARRLSPVDQNIGMVNDLLIARTDFDRPHVARARDRRRNDKIAVDIAATGLQGVRARHPDYNVRLSKLPALDERRGRGQIGPVALRCSLLHPSLEENDLLFLQPAFSLKLSIARFRQPRRHVSAARNFDNLPGVFPYVRIGQQAERRGLTRPMARRAVREHHGSDVLAKCYCIRERRL